MPGAYFPVRPQQLCCEDTSVREESYLFENCRADKEICRGHIFPYDRSSYAARIPLCEKRFISSRTEVRGGRL